MSVRKLQNQRGIVSTRDLHEETQQAYPSYRQLTDGLLAMPTLVQDTISEWVESLYTLSTELWGDTANNQRWISIDEFKRKYADTFEMLVSPSARGMVDTRGLIIIIGEHHTDPNTRKSIATLMKECLPGRGDRFYMESDREKLCHERAELYGIHRRHCRLLEKNSVTCATISSKLHDSDTKLLATFAYIKKHFPAAEKEIPETEEAMVKLCTYYAFKLPEKSIAAYNSLMRAYDESANGFRNLLRETIPLRDLDMARFISKDASKSAWNFAVIGALHLRGVRHHLRDLPCVFMIPKSLTASFPQVSLRELEKDEL